MFALAPMYKAHQAAEKNETNEENMNRPSSCLSATKYYEHFCLLGREDQTAATASKQASEQILGQQVLIGKRKYNWEGG